MCSEKEAGKAGIETRGLKRGCFTRERGGKLRCERS